ncbi:hypothetical protein CEXT_669381 [Caerostris extrusa]|uniref:Uncharacterized protein n=1 Tax=Caerostris extrusa TaxID=172846 RepID=A0AAV4N8S6_CAEEX|nr:hypothetical protein CEXT_669381 [Caerostris extrusa]
MMGKTDESVRERNESPPPPPPPLIRPLMRKTFKSDCSAPLSWPKIFFWLPGHRRRPLNVGASKAPAFSLGCGLPGCGCVPLPICIRAGKRVLAL